MPAKPVSRRRFAALSAAALLSPSVLRAAPPVETLTGQAFATGWRVTLPAGRLPGRHRAGIEAILAAVDLQMSPWRADSAVSAFNRAASASRLPEETLRVARAALAIASASGGRFDPTVGPLVARWGFGPIRGDEAPGWRGLGTMGGTLVKSRPGLTLDLCGIAKGHALDRIAALLRDRDEADFLIDLGGELCAAGRHPEGRSWQVAIEDPRPAVAGAAEVLRLDDISVATSGSRAQSYRLASRDWGHIIDPLRRAPASSRLASVSVIATDAMTADGWATALVAAGATDGPAIAQERGLTALFLIAGPRRLARIATGGFDRHLA